MKKETLLVILSFYALLSACKKENTAYNRLPENRVRFDQMAVGQKSQYLRFEAGDCELTYTTDTMVLEVVGQQSDTFILKEYLTPHSFSILEPNTPNAIYYAGETEVRLFIFENTVRVLPSPDSWLYVSRLFSTLQLPLSPIDEPKVPISCWYPLPSDGHSKTGYLKSYSQMGISFPKLNLALNYEPMLSDGPGIFCLYTADLGMVRTASRNGWLPEKGYGWDLLPE